MTDLAQLVREIAEEMAAIPERGDVASYIAPLAAVDPSRFGLCVITADDEVHLAGDALEPFSIQSISKVFALTQALGKVGEALWQRVGREPSGTPFNSIVQLEREQGIPRNPFIKRWRAGGGGRQSRRTCTAGGDRRAAALRAPPGG